MPIRDAGVPACTRKFVPGLVLIHQTMNEMKESRKGVVWLAVTPLIDCTSFYESFLATAAGTGYTATDLI